MIIKYSYKRRNYHSSQFRKQPVLTVWGRGKAGPLLTARYYLRQLPVCSSEASETFLEERVNFRLLYGGG